MNTRPVTSAAAATRPYTGVRRSPWSMPNRCGKSPSWAAASETRAVSRIHPFKAPNAETMPTTPTTLPQLPPKISRAASANGALEPASVASGRMPITATVAMM